MKRAVVEVAFSIGADPEFFLTNAEGSLVSAIPVVKGTKEQQLQVSGGGLQHDNVAAEFSCDPANSEEGFVETIGNMLGQLAKHVHPLVINAIPSAEFPQSELESMEAKEFGCDPDFDAYAVNRNIFDASLALNPLRSCGGHIHVGIKDGLPKILSVGDKDEKDCPEECRKDYGKIRLVKAMDLFLAIPSLLLDIDEAAKRRRELYGKAGAHRPKSYGVEYRTLSNFWTKSPELVKMVYRLTAASIRACETGYDKICFGALGDGDVLLGEKIVQKTINGSNVDRAISIIDNHILPVLDQDTIDLFNKAKDNAVSDVYREWGVSAA